MKILFLSKRRPQGKDLLTRPYGRFFHIPRILSERGHQVTLLLLSHRRDPGVTVERKGLTLISESLYPAGPFAYVSRAKRLVEQVKPDWIVGFSDTYYGILAVRLAQRYHIGSVIDAYDNYESYIPWLKPLHHFWRKALARATLVTAAGPHLAGYMASFRQNRQTRIIPMASDPNFDPLDKAECRRKLDLPLNKKILGYCGTIHRGRGVDILFRSYERLRKDKPTIELALTGRKQRGLSVPSHARWLGYLPDEDMPLLLNSLDVLFVSNQPSDFGMFSYPVKLYEAMRCHIPVVATDTPPVRWILEQQNSFIADPADDVDLDRKVAAALEIDRYDYGEQNTWEQVSIAFEKALLPPRGY